MAAITINKEHYGVVKIHYPASDYAATDFLPEELDLLKKVAEEMAAIIERAERKNREELLERSARRNDRLAILGEITAGIAHELNTPLGNILGFAELIKDKTDELQVRSDSEKIINSAVYAREVVKKLMFFSCEMPQQMESVSINEIVKDALQLLKPTFSKAGLLLVFEPDPGNAFGRLDPIQITQVIFNLVINSIYASAPQSTVLVKLLSEHKKIHITISDQGSGIPEEAQDRIFEPFFTTKPVGEGSGLGLSVVHGIVKSHRGSIHFSTEQGKGTTFNVVIPLHG
jgi:signal transduction histidine kinase